MRDLLRKLTDDRITGRRRQLKSGIRIVAKWLSIGAVATLLIVVFTQKFSLPNQESPRYLQGEQAPMDAQPAAVESVVYDDGQGGVSLAPELVRASHSSDDRTIQSKRTLQANRISGHDSSEVDTEFGPERSVDLPDMMTANRSGKRHRTDAQTVTNPVTGDGPLGSGPPLIDSGLPGPGEMLNNLEVLSGPGPSQIDQGLPGPGPSLQADAAESLIRFESPVQGQTGSAYDSEMTFETDRLLPGPGEEQLDPVPVITAQ